MFTKYILSASSAHIVRSTEILKIVKFKTYSCSMRPMRTSLWMLNRLWPYKSQDERRLHQLTATHERADALFTNYKSAQLNKIKYKEKDVAGEIKNDEVLFGHGFRS
ncbi:uncharacterized protein LOC113464788 [Ceratina calcarata]|uniref:Uncharacterized protein LOC113464788 n=1 Tax=Ceratina calcarata TaxID=156304 RepID=A0AAJ7S6L5_9HYME|nr:uncharacterized protein LOC113464788 [Ceratina calcarata]